MKTSILFMLALGVCFFTSMNVIHFIVINETYNTLQPLVADDAMILDEFQNTNWEIWSNMFILSASITQMFLLSHKTEKR